MQGLGGDLSKRLQVLSGFQLTVSSVVKDISSLRTLSPIFLDMVGCSQILFDPNNIAKDLLKKTENWIQRHGAKKIQKGLLWYWILDTVTPPGLPIDMSLE